MKSNQLNSENKADGSVHHRLCCSHRQIKKLNRSVNILRQPVAVKFMRGQHC